MNEWFVEPELSVDVKKEQPASYLRQSFLLGRPSAEVVSARLSMTGLGVYTGYVNGRRFGRQRLSPGYTDYRIRLQVQTLDVREDLTDGENVIAAVLGDGWYRGCIGIGSRRNSYGTKLKWMFSLKITYTDGSVQAVHSDSSCLASQAGPLRENNLKTIERYDAAREDSTWNLPGYAVPADRWHGVLLSRYAGKLIPEEGERVLEQEHFTPKVLHTPHGETVLDMGQNFAGFVRFRVSGPAGWKVSLTMGEELDADGNFTMANLAARGAKLISGLVGQKLEYTLREGQQTYEPYFLISGFRYVLVENWPEEVLAANFTGIAVYSDLRFDGDFQCSDALINQLVRNVRWSEKSNFVDIPTDCPTRERSGWTADISVFAETACFLSDARKFLRKWLADYKAEQTADGNLPFVVPTATRGEVQWGCMGWSNAIANISMTLYRFYGCREDLAEVYDCVARFVEFCLRRARKNRIQCGLKQTPWRKYLIEDGFHYGEWLEPGVPMYYDYLKALCGFTDTEATTAWFYMTVKQLSKMAKILDRKEDYEKYYDLSERIRKAYQHSFLKNGRVQSKRICRYVRPLSMGLIDPAHEKEVATDLNRKCIENQYHIGTGFLTTWVLLDTLSAYGYLDTAYRILENTQKPGWLYAVTRGATTTWESWDGLDEKGNPVDSHNHYAPDAVVAWLFHTCAGISPETPGFGRVRIAPHPGGSLTYADAVVGTVHGRIRSGWKLEDGLFSLYVEIPDGVEAEILLPDGSACRQTTNRGTYQCRIGVSHHQPGQEHP